MRNLAAIISVIGLLLCSIGGFAQQDPMFSMYQFDKMLINPAFTGSSSWMVGTAKYRAQFTGLGGNPTTQTFNFHSPLKSRKMGLGFKVINDEIAIVKNLNATLFYSYHLFFAGGKLSFGLEGGFYNRRIQYDELILTTLGDNALPTTTLSSSTPDASWGVYYQKEKFYAGFSQHHVLGAKFDDLVDGEPQSKLFAHTNFLVGHVVDLNDKFSLEPSMLVKSVSGAPTQLDVNAILYYRDLLGAGFQYRTGDAFGVTFKVNISESLRIAYGFDSTISGLSDYSNGAHEILISYGIKLPPPPAQREIHPRYYF